MRLCPKCGAKLVEVAGGYLCHECGGGMFREDETVIPLCPHCNSELGDLCGDYYCYSCSRLVSKQSAVCSSIDFEDPDYDSMIDNGDSICLNCTYWSVSPHGSAYGMVCRRNYPTNGPGDSCSSFVPSVNFASYGDDGQYQFNETRQNTKNKLFHWKNSR